MEEIFDINKSNALIFENDNGEFTLSPRGCFALALADTGIGGCESAVELNDQAKFGAAFSVLVKRFEDKGWIDYEGKEPTGTREDQKAVFIKTVRVYFKEAGDDELEAAFDEFMILLEKHGYVKQ